MTAETVSSEQQITTLPEEVELRILQSSDIHAALRLSQEAGWNQVAADWQIFLDLGVVYGLFTRSDSRLVSTAATLPHGMHFAWISMVLVASDCRRRGLARWLLRHCVRQLLDRQFVPALDATPAGRSVYLQLGFRDCWSMRRLVLHRPLQSRNPEKWDGALVRPLHAGDWPALLDYDRAVFGGDRAELLRRLADRLPEAALVAERSGGFKGYLLGRDGRVMTQLGPLIAEDEETAEALLRRAFLTLPLPYAIDLANRHERLGHWLTTCGFVVERPFTRMMHERSSAFDDPARFFAAAGPELG